MSFTLYEISLLPYSMGINNGLNVHLGLYPVHVYIVIGPATKIRKVLCCCVERLVAFT